MELDEFKLLWNNSLLADKKATLQQNELDVILDSVLKKVNQLAQTSKFWWKISAIGIGLVFMFLVVTASLYIWYPESLSSLKNALPVLILLPVFISIVGILYYKQSTIFDIYKYSNLASALSQIIVRFKNWYMCSVIIFGMLLYPVFYFLLIGVEHKFNIALSLTSHLISCGLLTTVTLLMNHLHYKKTYFQWLKYLENNLKDLAVSIN